MTWLILTILWALPAGQADPEAPGALVVEVRHDSRPLAGAVVTAGERRVVTGENGVAVLQLPPGEATVVVESAGFAAEIAQASIAAGETARLTVELELATLRQEVTVTATRTEQRIEDAPIRVEVLEEEEIEEKALMTPGDIAMLLNETGGLRVQVTSPSLGAANVRVQGLRGRYTQLLADGLPLYGGQTGAIGLLQIPPLDLGRVEVIKGAASAFYGASALGGVVNLISRRPEEPAREFLFNRTSRNGTDGVFWLATPLGNRWSYSLLGGGHHQTPQDVDGDGWSDMPGHRRGVVRPRFFWDDGEGRSVFLTAGAMIEDRRGGALAGGAVPDGGEFPEELTTRRFDAGLVGRFLIGRRVVSLRGSAMTQRRRHRFGEVIERDRHHTLFGEAALNGTDGNHTWAAGAALQADLYRSRDVSRFDYAYTTPGVFVQDDYTVNARLTLSGGARADFHSDYGVFVNPRVSALIRLPRRWTARLSTGTGVFAPTPFTEETEAVGLTNLRALDGLAAERAWSASADLGWTGSEVELNGGVFGSVIRDPIVLRRPAADASWMEIVNAAAPVRTVGTELLARFRRGDVGVTFTHTFIRATETEPDAGGRREVPLTPRHAVGVVGMWEREDRGRIGLEIFFTGRQALDHNPYRSESRPYWVVGILAERRFGAVRLFVNGENLTDARQTRYDPLLRPERGADGRWAVDAWAPLEGRVINGGVRLSF